MSTTTTTVEVPEPRRSGASRVRVAEPFLIAGDRDGAPVRLPGLRLVVGHDELPAPSLRRLLRLPVGAGTLSALSSALGAAAAGIPRLDAWTVRFATRGGTVSVLAREETLVVASVAPSPDGWPRCVAAVGVVCLALELRPADPAGVLAARVPVCLG